MSGLAAPKKAEEIAQGLDLCPIFIEDARS
jgi:hypothetical protein